MLLPTLSQASAFWDIARAIQQGLFDHSQHIVNIMISLCVYVQLYCYTDGEQTGCSFAQIATITLYYSQNTTFLVFIISVDIYVVSNML